ncbi:MAG: DUF4886 domain-containing protein [Lentisphaerae bacterium]|jgi:hypothetical protein|nr:DUF4886 domain-containing protein [Lentisphaerota bacterium]
MKILTIGNSFTDSLTAYFPQTVHSINGQLQLGRASFGGCELRRHWSYVTAEENDPSCIIYGGGGRKLRDILNGESWDVVTVQQASHESWRSECFEPYAGNLIEYVRRHAPGAEVIIQQTWAYRADHPQLQPGSEWNINQTDMYQRLTKNYREMAAHHQCRMIPTGHAVQLSRENEESRFSNYSPSLLNTLRWPDLPPQGGDVVGQCFWRKNAETGELEIVRDLIHLNCRGQYLQACVWTAFLYQKNTSEITFVPEELSNSDAAFLRKIAQQVVDSPHL